MQILENLIMEIKYKKGQAQRDVRREKKTSGGD